MSSLEEQYAEVHTQQFLLGISIGELAVKQLGRRKRHFSMPVIIETQDELLALRHSVRRSIDDFVACDSNELGAALSPQQITAIDYGAKAGYGHLAVILDGARI